MLEAPEETPRQDNRKQDIADAARYLIAERGFEGLRTRDIADRVGINIATLHYHIPTKQDLVRLVAESLRTDFVRQHQRRPRQGLSPVDRLRQEFADFRENLESNIDLFTVMAELGERARRDPEVRAELEPMRAYWHAQIADFLKAGRDDGSFRGDLDPQAAASIVIGTLTGSRRQSDPSLAHFDAICAELLRCFQNP